MTETDTTREAHDWAALKRLAEAATQHQEEWWETTALRVDCGMDYPDAAYIAAAHPQAVLALLAALERAEAERDELQDVFDRSWNADMRAIKAWQAANPGNDLVWPDRTALVSWLLAERDAARAEAARLREAIDEAHSAVLALGMEDPDGRIESIRLTLARAWQNEALAQEPGHE